SPCSVAAVKNERISTLSLCRGSQSEGFSNDARVNAATSSQTVRPRSEGERMARGEHCRRWQNATLRLNFGYLGSTLMCDSCPTCDAIKICNERGAFGAK